MVDNGLHQLNESPTRDDNILDLVFVNDPLIVDNLEVGPHLGNSDHNTVMFDLLVNTVPESTDSTEILPKLFRYDFHKADWVALRNALNEVDWHFILYDTPNVDVLWEKFTNTLWEVIDEHVPKIENVSNRKSSYKKAKYPCHIKKLFNQKLHLWRLFKRTGYEHHKAKFQDIKKCIAAINKFHSDNESKLINNGNLGNLNM